MAISSVSISRWDSKSALLEYLRTSQARTLIVGLTAEAPSRLLLALGSVAPSTGQRRDHLDLAFVLEPRLPARKQAQIDAVIEDGERRCFAGLTAAERRELLRLMDKCIAHLEPEGAAR
jgi:hypothetical protein